MADLGGLYSTNAHLILIFLVQRFDQSGLLIFLNGLTWMYRVLFCHCSKWIAGYFSFRKLFWVFHGNKYIQVGLWTHNTMSSLSSEGWVGLGYFAADGNPPKSDSIVGLWKATAYRAWPRLWRPTLRFPFILQCTECVFSMWGCGPAPDM